MNRSRLHVTIVMLTLCALLLHSVLPFFATYTPEGMQAKAGITMVICTEQGFRLIKAGDAPSNSHHARFECALCYFAAHGQPVPALAPKEIRVSFGVAVATYLSQQSTSPAIAHRWQNPLSHAPPVSFVS